MPDLSASDREALVFALALDDDEVDGHPVFDVVARILAAHGVHPGREPRAYVVGLPVAVTVYDDGRVEFSVDVSEADDIEPPVDAEGVSLYPEAIVDADAAQINDVTSRHPFLPTVTLSATPQESPDA